MNSNNHPNNLEQTKEEKLIPMDGFQQILDMMEVADASFREVLMKNLQRKNPQLAHEIRRHLITT